MMLEKEELLKDEYVDHIIRERGRVFVYLCLDDGEYTGWVEPVSPNIENKGGNYNGSQDD